MVETEKLKNMIIFSYDEDNSYYTMIIREDGYKIKTAFLILMRNCFMR